MDELTYRSGNVAGPSVDARVVAVKLDTTVPPMLMDTSANKFMKKEYMRLCVHDLLLRGSEDAKTKDNELDCSAVRNSRVDEAQGKFERKLQDAIDSFRAHQIFQSLTTVSALKT